MKMTTRETELERQLSHIVKECEASSTQSKRIQRIKARAEAAINGSDPDFKSVGDRRDDKIAHIGQLNMMNAQLQSTIAALEAEVMRLRNALETFIAEHEECEDSDGWMAQMCSMEALHAADEAMSIPNYTSAFDAYVANQREAAYQEARRAAAQFEAELARQRDLAVEALEKQGHSAGCRKNAFGDIGTCGLDDLLSTIKEIEAMAQGEQG